MSHVQSSCAGDVPAMSLITLNTAAAQTPGRPHVSCVWRWCRRGVKARAGPRVRLEHVRVGGKIFTTQAWLNAFGRELAAADTAYFAGKQEEAKSVPPRDAAFGSPRDRRRASRAGGQKPGRPGPRRPHDELDAELRGEGL